MSWRTVRLGDLVDNFSVRAKDVGGADGLDFYGVSNEEGIIKTKYAAEDKAVDYKIIEKGCFAYNPYRVNVGSIGLVSDDTRGLISPAYVVFKPKPKSIISELLLKFLKSDEGLRQIKFYARGTVRQALRFEDLCNIEITIPEYDDQQNLYRKLIKSQEASNILDAELKIQLELLKQLRQQLLQDAVQGKLVEQNPKDEPASELLKKVKAEKQKFIAKKKLKKEKELTPIKPEEIPFEIPESWVWCRLGEICEFKNGKAHEQYIREEGKFILVTSRFVSTSGKQIKRATKMLTPLYKNEIVIVMSDVPGGRALGRAYLIEKDDTYTLNQRIGGISPFIINSHYLCLALDRNMHFLNFDDGKKQTNLRKDQILSCLIPIPPFYEQNRIVQKVEELMRYCNELEDSIQESESQNEKLLQQALREALSNKTALN
ncbi:MAG: hypothetical protein FJX92_05520 [Bacteroidetes bacterium]|nr:hypothetical protein [Bacteroidota bacterium]MBM3432443.1 hypothetical protein [Bacteroidota bacterium]